MSVDLVKTIYAEDVNVGDELDFAEDEYCWNDLADSGYAMVNRRTEWYNGHTSEPWVTLYTSQGDFEMPAAHMVRRRIIE